jgi:hypothetical protein
VPTMASPGRCLCSHLSAANSRGGRCHETPEALSTAGLGWSERFRLGCQLGCVELTQCQDQLLGLQIRRVDMGKVESRPSRGYLDPLMDRPRFENHVQSRHPLPLLPIIEALRLSGRGGWESGLLQLVVYMYSLII